MSSGCFMKQVKEKHVSTEILHCLWSPKMDLIAIANVQGQVVLHRLSWQQVWLLNPPKENLSTTALAWRPDSKILAVSYDTGKVLLLNVEDSSVIFEHDLQGEVSALSWHSYSKFEETTVHREEDPWASYAYSLPPLSKSFHESGNHSKTDAWQEPRLLQNQSELNMLYIGVIGCSLHLFAFGLLHISTIDIKVTSDPFANRILSIAPSLSLDLLSLVVEKIQGHSQLCNICIDCSVISQRHRELHSLAQIYGQIHSVMSYISHTLTLIEEAWDSALIEIDAELTEYASNLPGGTVSAEFLRLLVFGYSTSSFKKFLTSKINEVSLKKLRQSFDLCYSTMQRLVVKHLQQAAVSLIFLLSQVRGMSERKDLYECLGVIGSDATKSVSAVGSFLLKVSEFLQAIDSSTKDFHVFLRWLSSVHLRLRCVHVPSDLSRISQFEMMSLLHFLNDSLEQVVVDSSTGKTKSHFRLERTGQYLKNESLKTQIQCQQTPFAQLLSNNPSLAAHPYVFTHNSRSSLLQEHQTLVSSLTELGILPGAAIKSHLKSGESVVICSIDRQEPPAVSQIPLLDGSIACAIIPSTQHCCNMLLLEICNPLSGVLRTGSFTMDGTNGPPHDLMTMVDIQFYSPEIISVLMTDPGHPKNPIFAQLSVQSIYSELTELNLLSRDESSTLLDKFDRPINISLIPESVSWLPLEPDNAVSIAVSGPRKVAAVVGTARRRIRIYEVGDDEDDEEDLNDTKEDSVVDISANTDGIANSSS